MSHARDLDKGCPELTERLEQLYGWLNTQPTEGDDEPFVQRMLTVQQAIAALSLPSAISASILSRCKIMLALAMADSLDDGAILPDDMREFAKQAIAEFKVPPDEDTEAFFRETMQMLAAPPAAPQPQSAEADAVGLKFCCAKAEEYCDLIAKQRNVVNSVLAGADPKEAWNRIMGDNKFDLSAAPQQEPVEVRFGCMSESNGRDTWIVSLAKPGATAFDSLQIYAAEIKGRAEYERDRLLHFFGQGPEPDLLKYDTEDRSAHRPEELPPHKPWTNLSDHQVGNLCEIEASRLNSRCDINKNFAIGEPFARGLIAVLQEAQRRLDMNREPL